MGTNGITYNRDPFARAARLIRGLGCEVAADKRQVPVLYHETIVLASIMKAIERKTGRENSASHPATVAGFFMQ